MDTTGKTKHITCRIKESLLEQIEQRMKQSPSEENRSDFINKALELALGNQQQSFNEFANMAKRVEALISGLINLLFLKVKFSNMTFKYCENLMQMFLYHGFKK